MTSRKDFPDTQTKTETPYLRFLSDTPEQAVEEPGPHDPIRLLRAWHRDGNRNSE